MGRANLPDERRFDAMNRSRGFLLVAVMVAIGGCNAAGDRTSTPTTPLTALASLNASARPVAGTPGPKPAATLAVTIDRESQAPADAVLIKMIVDSATARPHFEPDRITAKAGTVVFFLENITGTLGPSDHNMLIGPAIRQELARTPTIHANETATFTVKDLTPGSYVFWCSVKDAHDPIDHASEGMVGTLTITP